MGEKVLGTGVDLIEIGRVGEMLQKWDSRFRDRIFTPEEQSYCESKATSAMHYAGRFAVKEAVSKALGTGLGKQLGWLDIEVARDGETGAPSCRLSEAGEKLMAERGGCRILISLSHTHEHAIAQAILVGEGA